MCGIFGYWDRSRRPLEEGVLRAMAQSLVHRGPDDEGIWHQPMRGVAIGNRQVNSENLLAAERERLAELESRWSEEKTLVDELLANPGIELDIDVASNTVTLPDGRSFVFPIDGFARTCLLEGVDQLGYLLKQQSSIHAYEDSFHAR